MLILYVYHRLKNIGILIPRGARGGISVNSLKKKKQIHVIKKSSRQIRFRPSKAANLHNLCHFKRVDEPHYQQPNARRCSSRPASSVYMEQEITPTQMPVTGFPFPVLGNRNNGENSLVGWLVVLSKPMAEFIIYSAGSTSGISKPY